MDYKTTDEYCYEKGLSNRLWETFTKRYKEFVVRAARKELPILDGKILVTKELEYVANEAIKSVMDID